MAGYNTQQYLNPVQQWLLNHLRALVFCVSDLCKAPLTTLLTVCVIAITIALPSGFYQLLTNYAAIGHNITGSPQLSLYLKQNLAPDVVPTLIQQIKAYPAVKTVQYISPSQGFEQFKQFTQLGDVLARIKQNPLPGVLVIKPNANVTNPEQLSQLLTQLKRLPQIDIGQLDITWTKRLYYLMILGRRITYGLSILFALAVLLIIGNTIRLTMQRNQEEIAILQLIGATKNFIRRPLLYRGVIYGLFGGFLAWLIVCAFLTWVAPPAFALVNTYHNSLKFNYFNLEAGFYAIIVSGVLGFVGSWFAMRSYLQ